MCSSIPLLIAHHGNSTTTSCWRSNASVAFFANRWLGQDTKPSLRQLWQTHSSYDVQDSSRLMDNSATRFLLVRVPDVVLVQGISLLSFGHLSKGCAAVCTRTANKKANTARAVHRKHPTLLKRAGNLPAALSECTEPTSRWSRLPGFQRLAGNL